MTRMRVMTIVGTRPEIIKMSEIIKRCDQHFEHMLVHSGQNYDYSLNEVFFDDLELRPPDHYLGVVGGDLGQTLGNILSKSYELMQAIKPDALLVLGDTNTGLSVISAKRLKIPVFHLEAGNRCFDENLPEEVNRRIIDHTSDVNLCYTEHARRYLNHEGVPMERTFVVGSPMTEVIAKHYNKIAQSTVLERLQLREGQYILLSAHREENIDNEHNLASLVCSINALAETYDMPVIYSTHPRSKLAFEKRNIKFHPKVASLKPFGFIDYNNLQLNSYCVVSDSGTLAEEASILRFPAVSIRTSTERPEAVDKGTMTIGGLSALGVLSAVRMSVDLHGQYPVRVDVPDYLDQNVSMKVVKIIQGYTQIINGRVWRKHEHGHL